MQAIVHGFANLLRFSGRDRRGQFWPYAAVVFVAGFVIMGGGLATVMQSVFVEAAAFAEANPEAVTIQQSATSYSVQIEPGAGFAPDLSAFFVVLGVCTAVIVLLLAAAVTRRLHDRGLPGYMGLPPVVFLGLGVFGMARLMASMDAPEPDLALFGLMMLNNLLYLASLAGLIVLLAQPGKALSNRYGPPPAD